MTHNQDKPQNQDAEPVVYTVEEQSEWYDCSDGYGNHKYHMDNQ